MKKTLYIVLIIIPLCLNFFSNQGKANSPEKSIAIDFEKKSNQTLSAIIKANQIGKPTFGIAFDLLYDHSKLRYQSYQEGAWFEKGGKAIYLVSEPKDNQGRLIVGVALKRGDTQVQGSGNIIKLNFSIMKSGTVAFKFQNMHLITTQTAKKEIEGVEWNDNYVTLTTSAHTKSNKYIIMMVLLLSIMIFIKKFPLKKKVKDIF